MVDRCFAWRAPRIALLCLAIVLPILSPPAFADCFASAAAYQHVNPILLRAIAWQESRGVASALHSNTNGSIDVGMAQINSIHFPVLAKYGIAPKALYNGCVNVYVEAWLLKQKMDKHGNTWAAVGAYHSETPGKRDAYARSIHAILVAWRQLPGPAGKLYETVENQADSAQLNSQFNSHLN